MEVFLFYFSLVIRKNLTVSVSIPHTYKSDSAKMEFEIVFFI